MVSHTHNLSLMIVAIVVSVVASFTGLALTNNIVNLPENTRKALVTMSSLVIGGGIWTMHFVAMLANEFSVPVGYDVVYTLGSGLVSILVVGVALLILHYSMRTSAKLNLAGVILGAGIVSMHYIGMSAMRGATPLFGIGSVLLATVAAAVTGVVAIRIAYGKRSKEHIVAGGFMLGMSVVVVHYTAMLGTHYQATTGSDSGTIAIANPTLAIVLVVAVFMICGAFLLVATTFLTTPERHEARSLHEELKQHTDSLGKTEKTDPQANSPTTSTHAVSNLKEATVPPFKENTKPLQGIATEQSDSVTLFSQENHSGGVDSESDHIQDDSAAINVTTSEVRIPFERNKKISFLDSALVGAIRADGRYTQLYTQKGVHFCPWSITEAEKRLLGTSFYRAHRSYLVNVQVLTSFEKRKDSGVCLFDGFDQITRVPVSRTRVSGLMELLGLT